MENWDGFNALKIEENHSVQELGSKNQMLIQSVDSQDVPDPSLSMEKGGQELMAADKDPTDRNSTPAEEIQTGDIGGSSNKDKENKDQVAAYDDALAAQNIQRSDNGEDDKNQMEKLSQQDSENARDRNNDGEGNKFEASEQL